MAGVLGLTDERLLGEIVAPFLDGQHRATLPILRLLELGVGLIAQSLLVGDGGRHLLLGLHELAAHVDEDLRQHLLRILGLRDQVVDVGLEESGETVEDTHRNQRASRYEPSSRRCDASASVMLS